MGRIIAIANQKGGVGKTTTAVNLAVSMAANGKPILLIDLDPQGNATSGLADGLATPSATSYHVLTGLKPPSDAVLPAKQPGLWIIPANRDLAAAEVELVNVERREFRLRDALRDAVAAWEYVFVDCPPSLGMLTVNALVCADTVLVPLQAEYYALEGLAHLMNTIRRVRQRLNPALSIEGILLTMVDSRTNLAHQVEQEVRKHFPGEVFATTVPRSVKLSEAPSFGKPILHYDPHSRGCQAYVDLAQEILVREANPRRSAAGAGGSA
ncbi:MAG: Chromosome partitioning protein ParA [Myxococcota bacterium]|nr:Chromosome partitioning protein ParA [Myxococcota bacterium]